jgi:uncharacterized integral membrane protein (TIGR00698 family)
MISRVHTKGILLSVLIGLSAYFISFAFPFFNNILLGLLMGMIIGNFVPLPGHYQSGISFTSSKLLEFSLLFLAFGISYTSIAKIGAMSFIFVIVMITAVLLLTISFSRKMRFNDSTCYLIGFGTAICGSSAIAAVSSSVTKNKEDIGISLAVVNLLGAIGMISLPLLFSYLPVSNLKSGFMIGASLHSVGNVAGAGYAMGDEIGQTAITIKLARVALLSPALIFFRYLVNKDSASNWKEHFRLPWYVWSFICISMLTSILSIPANVVKLTEDTGKIILTVAMAAIGLKVSFRTLYQSGKKAVLLGLIIFVIQLVLLGTLVLFL